MFFGDDFLSGILYLRKEGKLFSVKLKLFYEQHQFYQEASCNHRPNYKTSSLPRRVISRSKAFVNINWVQWMKPNVTLINKCLWRNKRGLLVKSQSKTRDYHPAWRGTVTCSSIIVVCLTLRLIMIASLSKLQNSRHDELVWHPVDKTTLHTNQHPPAIPCRFQTAATMPIRQPNKTHSKGWSAWWNGQTIKFAPTAPTRNQRGHPLLFHQKIRQRAVRH